jgi:hypothetical protein
MHAGLAEKHQRNRPLGKPGLDEMIILKSV